MSSLIIQSETLTSIGDAIRAKTGETGLIRPGDMASKILGITTGGSATGGSVDYFKYETEKQISDDLILSHSLGRIPNRFLMSWDGSSTGVSVAYRTVFHMFVRQVDTSDTITYRREVFSNGSTATLNGGIPTLSLTSTRFSDPAIEFTENEVKISLRQSDTTTAPYFYIRPGVVYDVFIL